MALDLNSFNFDSMTQKLGADPFAEKSKYEEDTRFYKLGKDKDGNGLAVIAFLPDSESRPVQQMYKINTTINMNGKRRFVNEWSPASIGQTDPFQEMWQKYWNEGNKEEARKFSRITRFITNIKVIKDPDNPANEGKIFLYDMSHTMKDMIMKALNPSEQERALGEQPKEVFNPLKGWVFYLKCSKGANGILDYSRSEFRHLGENKSIYGMTDEAHLKETAEACEKDITNNTYKLSDFLIPAGQQGSVFKSYDELKQKLNYVTFQDVGVEDTSNLQNIQTVQEVKPEINSAQDTQKISEPNMNSDGDIDTLLAGL